MSKIKKTKFLAVAAALLLVFSATFALPVAAKAATPEALPAASEPQNTSDIGFYVRAVIPENQIDTDLSYFDLRMEPGASQTLEVELVNETASPISVDLNAISASTNRNGVIDYKTPDIRDETLAHPFSELASLEKNQVTIPANGVTMARVTLTMPPDSYDGVVLGGLLFTRSDAQGGESEGVAVQNVYSYVLGVKLSETDAAIAPDFELDAVEAGLVNYKPALQHFIRNKAPVIVKGMELAVTVKGSDGATVADIQKSGVDMAPNSVMPLAVSLEGGALEPGDYTAEVNLSYGGQTWQFSEAFTVGTTQAEAINNQSPALAATQSGPSLWLILLIVVGVLILIMLFILILLLLKRRKKEDDEDDSQHTYPRRKARHHS